MQIIQNKTVKIKWEKTANKFEVKYDQKHKANK